MSMVGVEVNKEKINQTAGDIARSLQREMRRAAEFKLFLDRFSAQDLVDQFAFTEGEANLIKSAFAEMTTVKLEYDDNKTFQRQLCGLGDV